tara:strand:- start:260 stop:475 length:216 start_codon:yes stop_codon:yes gene_type:complete
MEDSKVDHNINNYNIIYETVKLYHYLFIPKNRESFSTLFPSTVKVNEIGKWDHEYCNVKGTHYVAFVERLT